MKKEIDDRKPATFYEEAPCEKYLLANKYYLLKLEQAYHSDGRIGGTVLTYINENLGLEVVVSKHAKTAQVLIAGAGQIVAPMMCLYERIDLLEAFLVDAYALRASRVNPNGSNQR